MSKYSDQIDRIIEATQEFHGKAYNTLEVHLDTKICMVRDFGKAVIEAEILGAYQIPTSSETQSDTTGKKKVFRIYRDGGKIQLWLVDSNEKKHYVSQKKRVIPQGTILQFPDFEFTPPLRLLRSEIDNHFDYDGPDHIVRTKSDLPRTVAVFATAFPETGVYKGNVLYGLIFNMPGIRIEESYE